jgi:sugar lactone lactonase YvrE
MSDRSGDLRVIADGFAMGESPRWREGLLWFSDWGAGEIIALDLEGNRAATINVPFELPFCFDWSPDGSMLVVSGREARVVRRDVDGTFATFADLSTISTNPWNEIAVDAVGRSYVNSPDAIALVSSEGTVRKVADGGRFPNGMAISADNRILLMADSHAQSITAFDIELRGGLSGRRVWAELPGHPDGICLDAEGALWYADVPNQTCVRISEGAEVLDWVRTDRGCFSCALGGSDGRTLFIVAAQWRGMDKIAEVSAERTGQVLAVTVSVPDHAVGRAR